MYGGALLQRPAGVCVKGSSESSIFGLSQSNDGSVMAYAYGVPVPVPRPRP